MRWLFIIVLAADLISTQAGAQTPAQKSKPGPKPNMVLILADDLGYGPPRQTQSRERIDQATDTSRFAL